MICCMELDRTLLSNLVTLMRRVLEAPGKNVVGRLSWLKLFVVIPVTSHTYRPLSFPVHYYGHFTIRRYTRQSERR
jgi:hypothetical protein